VHLRTILGFRVDRLNTEIGAVVKTEVSGGDQPSLHFKHCMAVGQVRQLTTEIRN